MIRKIDRRSGVYTITNLSNGKIYVGSAHDLYQRKASHLYYLKVNKHHSPYLQRAWNKYGSENFKFEVIEYCDKEFCLSTEQYWMNMLNVCNDKYGYNLCPVAGNTAGRKASEETKKKMSIVKINNKRVYTEEYRKRISEIRKGTKHTKETLLKMRTKRKPEFGQIIKDCWINRKINYPIEKGKEILQYDLDGNFIREWSNISHTCRELKLSTGNLVSCLKGNRNKTGGFIWKYKNQDNE